MIPTIAIIDRNSLSLDALGDILHEMFPLEEICAFQSIGAFFRDCNRNFVYYFVSEDVMLSNAGEFETLKDITIVLSQGTGASFSDAGYHVLNVFQPQKDLVGDIVSLCESRVGGNVVESKIEALSSREREVLSLLVKGHINKEIADILNISTATAIFHRNNICEKLGTRSLGRLTILSLLSGLVKADEL